MAKQLMKTCKACRNEISRHAPFCRHCGHPQGSVLAIWALGLFLLLLVALYVAFCLYGVCFVVQ